MAVALTQRTGCLRVTMMLDRARAAIPEYVNRIHDEVKREAAERVYEAINDGRAYQVTMTPIWQQSHPFLDAEEFIQRVSISLVDPRLAEVGEYAIKPLEPILPYEGDGIGRLSQPFEREGLWWKRVF